MKKSNIKIAYTMLLTFSFLGKAQACPNSAHIGSYESGDGWVDTYQCPDGSYYDWVCSIDDNVSSCTVFKYR